MNKQLTDEEARAAEKLKGLRVGALFAYDRMSAVRVAVHILLYRLKSQKADGAIWLVSSNEESFVSGILDMLLGDQREKVYIMSFQSLSRNTDGFFDLLSLIRSQRVMLILDDGLYIKNVRAVRTQRVWLIAEGCPYRLLIASAPFERNQEDMFSQWYALDRRILGYISYWGFCANHIKNGRLINADYLSRAIVPYSVCIGREEQSRKREYVWQFRLPEEAYREYKCVVSRFEKKAVYSKAGIYRMLSACHMVTSGRRIVCDYPMETESMYKCASDDPRIQALFQILSQNGMKKTLIVCRFHFEMDQVAKALMEKYGSDLVHMPGDTQKKPGACYCIESLYHEKRALLQKCYQTVIYYSQNWSLRKRREKEELFSNNQNTTVVNIVAADTIDAQMVKRIWKKERSIEEVFKLLTGREEMDADAQDLQR